MHANWAQYQVHGHHRARVWHPEMNGGCKSTAGSGHGQCELFSLIHTLKCLRTAAQVPKGWSPQCGHHIITRKTKAQPWWCVSLGSSSSGTFLHSSNAPHLLARPTCPPPGSRPRMGTPPQVNCAHPYPQAREMGGYLTLVQGTRVLY